MLQARTSVVNRKLKKKSAIANILFIPNYKSDWNKCIKTRVRCSLPRNNYKGARVQRGTTASHTYFGTEGSKTSPDNIKQEWIPKFGLFLDEQCHCPSLAIGVENLSKNIPTDLPMEYNALNRLICLMILSLSGPIYSLETTKPDPIQSKNICTPRNIDQTSSLMISPILSCSSCLKKSRLGSDKKRCCVPHHVGCLKFGTHV